MPWNAVVTYKSGFVVVSSQTCEYHGYSTINKDECNDYYGGALGEDFEFGNGVPNGCLNGVDAWGHLREGWQIQNYPGECGKYGLNCVCKTLKVVSYTLCAPGQIVVNNACVQCNAWEIATSNGCQVCDSGQVPNANQTACVNVPWNGVVNYGFALVSSGSCETNGYSVINQDECRDYHGDRFGTFNYDNVPSGCNSGELNGWNNHANADSVCETNFQIHCICRAPPVSYTECPPGYIVQNNKCICPDGKAPNANQTACVNVPWNGVVQYENPRVNSGTCETNGYSVINQDECRDYHGDRFGTFNYDNVPSGCNSGELNGWNNHANADSVCETNFQIHCVCRGAPVSYTECPPGNIAANNACVQCNAWEIATSTGCQACPGQIPNADQSACVDIPLNAIVNYGFALVDSGSCESNGHTTLDAAGCTEYGNTITYSGTASVNTWLPNPYFYAFSAYLAPNGCTISITENGFETNTLYDNGLYFWYGFSSSNDKQCGSYTCICRSPPVSYTECPPGKIAVSNACVQCNAWEIATSNGCEVCASGQVPNANQTACVNVPWNGVVNYGFALVDDVISCEDHVGHATLDAAGCTEYGNTLNPTQQPITGHRWIEPQGCSLGRGSDLYFTVTGLRCGANNFPCVCRSPPVSYTECPPGKIAVNNACVQCVMRGK